MAARSRPSRRDDPDPATLMLELTGVRRGEPSPGEGFAPVTLLTSRGDIETRYYAAAGATGGAVFVGGAGGGFDTPVRGWLYPRLSKELQSDGVACLRVRYRTPNDLEECTLDVLAGIAFLASEGVERVALTGHSFGGAVVIQAAAHSDAVVTCVPMSTQTYGAGPVSTLAPRCSVLLAHGTADEILPHRCSEAVYAAAREPKRLLLKEGARHGLDEWSEELPGILREWIRTELSAPPRA